VGLGGFPVNKRIAKLGKATSESNTGHLSRPMFLSRIAAFNHAKVDVVVNINILYSDPQTRWISEEVTSGELELEHHCVTSCCLPEHLYQQEPLMAD
jgi:hypothetical protein